jgi:hypothetical protein
MRPSPAAALLASLVAGLVACSASDPAGQVDGGPASDAAPGGGADAFPDLPPGYGERCGNQLDDDDDGLADEDCAPGLFAGLFAPALTADPDLAALEAASGRRLAVVQSYRSLSALGLSRMKDDLAAIWARGQIPHMNLEPSGYSAAQYAAPGAAPLAADLAALGAALVAALDAAPGGRLLFTFGAEMNGNWVDWGCLPPADFVALYRAAHRAVGEALDAAAIDRRRVRWVYGPNSTSSGGCGSAAAYYPGHAFVDHLGMSSYRVGAASVATTVVAPAAAMFDALGYDAAWRRGRFIVLQTGTRQGAGDDRAAWLTELHRALTADDRFAGVIYFDAADWRVPPETAAHAAWAAALGALPVFDPALDGVFLPRFWDVSADEPYFPEIQALAAAGVTAGCGAAPARFCPELPLRRGDAAVLILRAFQLPAGIGAARYDDVPSDHPAFGAVQALGERGALAGCTTAAFCPDDPIDEAALVGALAAVGGQPPGPTGAGPVSRARAAYLITHAGALPPDR